MAGWSLSIQRQRQKASCSVGEWVGSSEREGKARTQKYKAMQTPEIRSKKYVREQQDYMN